MGAAEHLEQVRIWEKIYGKPKFGLRNFDPTQVKVCCAKCGKHRNKMSRHHKGAEFMFASCFPGWYAERYIQFDKKDCVRLCNHCHKRIEKLTEPLKFEFMRWLYRKKQEMRNPGGYPIRQEEVERFRLKIIARCERWLQGKRGRLPNHLQVEKNVEERRGTIT